MKLAIVVLFYFSNVFAQSFEPGIWKSKESLELNGITLPAHDSEECITPRQAKDAKGTIARELKRRGCSLTKWEVKNNILDAEILCKNEDMDAVGNLKGEFSKKSYDLKGGAKGTFKQVLPATAELHLSGKWIKKCPK